MPPELVRACRRRWKGLEAETRSVVPGDLTLENILRTPDGHLALIDWDESRVDAPLLDIAGLLDSNPGYPEGKWLCAKNALDAWEVAECWTREPEYARRRAEMMLAYTYKEMSDERDRD
jgi:thiamine kinase-like enzyme